MVEYFICASLIAIAIPAAVVFFFLRPKWNAFKRALEEECARLTKEKTDLEKAIEFWKYELEKVRDEAIRIDKGTSALRAKERRELEEEEYLRSKRIEQRIQERLKEEMNKLLNPSGDKLVDLIMDIRREGKR